MGAYISEEDNDDHEDVTLKDGSKKYNFFQSIESTIVAPSDKAARFVK